MPSHGSDGRACIQIEFLDMDSRIDGYFDPLDAHEPSTYPILPWDFMRKIFERKHKVCIHKYRILPKNDSLRQFMVELVLGIFQKTFLTTEVIAYE